MRAVPEEEPELPDNLSLLLEGNTISVQDAGGFYVMKSIETPIIRESHISKKGDKVYIYIDSNAELFDPAVFVSNGRQEMLDYMKNMSTADFIFHVILKII